MKTSYMVVVGLKRVTAVTTVVVNLKDGNKRDTGGTTVVVNLKEGKSIRNKEFLTWRKIIK